MKKIKLSPTLDASSIALGFWRLMDWKLSLSELQRLVEGAFEIGVTTFDHADIYGGYECEAEFGKLLKVAPSLREKMQLVTKCGIKILSSKYPNRKIAYYDTSKEHIIKSVEQSLRSLKTDAIDLLLIHRPDPLMDPDDTANAFRELEQSGKVLNFGVSNFDPLQFEMLNNCFDGKLVTNQVEISPYNLEHFDNGNMDFFVKEQIHPMSWSPLAGGKLIITEDEKGRRIHKTLREIADNLGIEEIAKIIYAWVLKHPSQAIPVIGSGRIERLETAVESLDVHMTREQWFEILVAAQGHPVP